jgi:hypothetical protein
MHPASYARGHHIFLPLLFDYDSSAESALVK